MSYHHPLSEPPPPRNRTDGRHRQPGHGPGTTRPTGPTGPSSPAWGDPMDWGSPAYDPYTAPAGGAPAYDPFTADHRDFATDHRDAFPEPGRQGPPPGPGHRAAPGDGHGRGDREGIRRLGSAYKLLRRVSTLTALGYFVLYLLLSAYAPGLMTTAVSGGLTVGVLLGLIQLPVALAAIAVYERIARVRVDPRAREVRERAEAAGTAPTAADRPARRRTTGGARA
ncbi:DUF485 domain-containing protein [Streptomyces sp. NPDC005805]|uniref:DUF485 domain-containing protein n=1 Tax=Streptomyces sp. NPDC005805 TaxID=3157068 RepID=UPI0033DD66FF